LRSRRNSLFPISCSVLVANARRCVFQGRRPPIAVARPSRPRFVAGSCLGEFALSSRARRCFYLALYCFLAPAWPAPANSGHGAAASCSSPAGCLPSPTPDLILANDLRSDGQKRRIPLRPAILSENPLRFLML